MPLGTPWPAGGLQRVATLELGGEAGARYADHVAAVIRWPNASVRLAAVEAEDAVGFRVVGKNVKWEEFRLTLLQNWVWHFSICFSKKQQVTRCLFVVAVLTDPWV